LSSRLVPLFRKRRGARISGKEAVLDPAQLALEQLPVADRRFGPRPRLLLRRALGQGVLVGGFEISGQLFDDLHLARAVKPEPWQARADKLFPVTLFRHLSNRG
jgi:hypothetical protein